MSLFETIFNFFKENKLNSCLISLLIYLIFIKYIKDQKIKKLNVKLSSKLTLKDSKDILYSFMYYEFPFLVVKSLEFGLFKTYSIPSISKILTQTKEMETNMSKRYDDTDLILREIFEHSIDSQRSTLALQRLNFLHGQYPITNNDYLYTLAVFIIEPIRWVNKYGYRKSHQIEKEAHYIFWYDIGSKMGIKNIPNSWEEVEDWMINYEIKHMKFHENNLKIKKATLDLFLSIVPSILHQFGDPILSVFCCSRLRAAMGLSNPPVGLTSFLEFLLFLQGNFIKYFLLPRFQPHVRTPITFLPSDNPQDNRPGKGCPLFHTYAPTYAKDGYRIDELGPDKFKSKRELSPLYPDIKASKK